MKPIEWFILIAGSIGFVWAISNFLRLVIKGEGWVRGGGKDRYLSRKLDPKEYWGVVVWFGIIVLAIIVIGMFATYKIAQPAVAADANTGRR